MWNTKLKGPHARPKSRWQDNIKLNIKALGLEIVDWIRLVMNVEPSGVIKVGNFLNT
jgi:hypothetical protein